MKRAQKCFKTREQLFSYYAIGISKYINILEFEFLIKLHGLSKFNDYEFSD